MTGAARRSFFSLSLDELPLTLPIFPLTGVLLLPGGKLPLHIFEQRYLNMVRDAIASDRLIGMVQPRDGSGPEGLTPDTDEEKSAVYPTGCAGRITAFSETEDGRMLITLTGICRFLIENEMPTIRGYRRVAVSWTAFSHDLIDGCGGTTNECIDRDRLTDSLQAYFRKHGLKIDWEAVCHAPDGALVTTLAMICPFAPQEKQALLETRSLVERAALMAKLIHMNLHEDFSGSGNCLH
ncbi:MAG: LON peptidase substrate-binding domain-containing protein [Alphaproteobacteria bacterium]